MLEVDLYRQINMTEVAIDKLIEARELEPNDPIIHFALVRCYILMVSTCVPHVNMKSY